MALIEFVFRCVWLSIAFCTVGQSTVKPGLYGEGPSRSFPRCVIGGILQQILAQQSTAGFQLFRRIGFEFEGHFQASVPKK
jgi:hypothetical protein